jgi:hypothetical protein
VEAVATTVVEGLPLPDRVEGGATFTAAAATATFTTLSLWDVGRATNYELQGHSYEI